MEQFTNRVLEASESSLARAHALRELAQHFPQEIEAQLDPNDGALLESLLAEHFNALRGTSGRVVAEVRQIEAVPAPAPPLPARNWQAHAHNLVTAAERLDQILTKLLAVSGSGSTQQALTSELTRAVAQMEAEITAAEPALRRTH